MAIKTPQRSRIRNYLILIIGAGLFFGGFSIIDSSSYPGSVGAIFFLTGFIVIIVGAMKVRLENRKRVYRYSPSKPRTIEIKWVNYSAIGMAFIVAFGIWSLITDVNMFRNGIVTIAMESIFEFFIALTIIGNGTIACISLYKRRKVGVVFSFIALGSFVTLRIIAITASYPKFPFLFGFGLSAGIAYYLIKSFKALK